MDSLKTLVCYRKLYDFFAEDCDLLEARWYTAIYPGSSVWRKVTAAKYAGWKPELKRIHERDAKTKGDMDAYISADLVWFATTDHPQIKRRVDQITLVCGDKDYRRALEHVKSQGIWVQILGSLQPGINGRCSPELIRSGLVDQFIPYEDILSTIARR